MTNQAPEFNRHLSTEDAVIMAKFIALALQADAAFSLEFDTGRYVSGEHMRDENGKFIPEEDIPDEHIIQGKQGFKIEVAGSYLASEDLQPELFASVGQAVQAGLQMLFGHLSDKFGKSEAIRIYSQFFKVIDEKN